MIFWGIPWTLLLFCDFFCPFITLKINSARGAVMYRKSHTKSGILKLENPKPKKLTVTPPITLTGNRMEHPNPNPDKAMKIVEHLVNNFYEISFT